MAQIVFSMPLSLFVYRVFLQITYFSPMQILAIFVILGIGATTPSPTATRGTSLARGDLRRRHDLRPRRGDLRRALSIFRETTAPTNEVNVVASWKELIGFVDGELRFVRVDAKLSVIEEGPWTRRSAASASSTTSWTGSNGRRGVPGDDLFHSPEAWVWYKTQTALIKGLLLGLSLAFPVAFAVLVLATQNVILATFAIASIGFIVSSVLGACYAMGWHLGVKESIAGVIVIGLAVDYTIHLGHMYDHARALGTRDREAKFEYASAHDGRDVAGPEDDRGNVYAIFRACKDACHL
ncbi:hypothetical protein JL720_7823 [Aureococcus anophagefferens]|nr:hypothetical protein JL720_7823 [Aureococcus anophagefferens]